MAAIHGLILLHLQLHFTNAIWLCIPFVIECQCLQLTNPMKDLYENIVIGNFLYSLGLVAPLTDTAKYRQTLRHQTSKV